MPSCIGVAETWKSAVAQVSKPAGAALFRDCLGGARLADLEVCAPAGLETCATRKSHGSMPEPLAFGIAAALESRPLEERNALRFIPIRDNPRLSAVIRGNPRIKKI